MVGGALEQGQRAAAVSALRVAAADGDLRDALPEATVPLIDIVGLPGILEELMGLEETSLVEQRDSSPASLLGRAHDLFRFSIVGQITRGNVSHAPNVMKRAGERNGVLRVRWGSVRVQR